MEEELTTKAQREEKKEHKEEKDLRGREKNRIEVFVFPIFLSPFLFFFVSFVNFVPSPLRVR
jgi:hypothetical protein